MATAAQVRANRANAQKSTGPRTSAGKETASQNALKHGLLAREAVIQGEDPEEFERYREWMLEELAPAGPVEAMLAGRVVGLSWRLRRAERLQNAALAALDEGTPTPLLTARLDEWKRLKGSQADQSVSGVADEDITLGRVVAEDFAEARVLDRMLMYERRIESSLFRTMAELRKGREARQAREAAVREEESRSEPRLQTGQESVTPARLASFGADAVPGTETRKITCGSPEPPAGVARGTGILPVVGNHGQDAHATEMPAGAPASPPAVEVAHHSSIPSFHPSSPVPDTPDAGGQSCETNPIWPGGGKDRMPDGLGVKDVGRGRPTYEETPGGAGIDVPAAALDRHSNTPSLHDSSPVLEAPAEKPSCETRPKSSSR